jgi:hypothetical protein
VWGQLERFERSAAIELLERCLFASKALRTLSAGTKIPKFLDMAWSDGVPSPGLRTELVDLGKSDTVPFFS